MKRYIFWTLLVLAVMAVASCDVKNGVVSGRIELPTDNTLNLYSSDEGIYPNTDILNDPANPFADAGLNSDNIWDFNDMCPSAKAKYYLWATYLAVMPTGENQYMTARALHELYTVGGSQNARAQALKAYRATLDNFYDAATWWKAWWIDDNTYYAVVIRNLVGQYMYDPTDNNLLPLYDDPAQALADLSQWGYVYDQETKTLTRVH